MRRLIRFSVATVLAILCLLTAVFAAPFPQLEDSDRLDDAAQSLSILVLDQEPRRLGLVGFAVRHDGAFAVAQEDPSAELEKIVAMGTSVNKSITSVYTLVLYAVVPFNLVKGVIVSVLTFLLYKRISPLMHKGDARKQQRKEA